MKTRYRWCAILLAGTALLSTSLAVACGQLKTQHEQSKYTAEEQQALELCNETISHIKKAHAVASELQKFSWNEFATIGVLLPPAEVCATGRTYIVDKRSFERDGMGRWVPLTEQLPSPVTAKTFSLSCNNCLILAKEVCLKNPYKESQASVREAEKPATPEWQQLCSQLQSSLGGAKYLVLNHKNVTTGHVFPEIEAQFNRSDEKIKQKYLDKFKAKCDAYIQLLDDVLYNIQQAQQIASELAGWQSNPENGNEQ